ncbi:MAG: filamentous hemagglutinin N-terminal domain-containing protein [Parachlamydiales bacterium]|nr:filamentous hemagglutinin N-terminal domain-containing protein [Parachlamydiales bacterium]
MSILKKINILFIFVILFFSFSLFSNPSNPEVIYGEASISENLNQLDITTSTNRTIINWQDFSIDQNEITNFIQPDISSACLNRVVSENPSNIMGTLTSNGQIFLINPNGIVIADTGYITTFGFIASTLDCMNEAFLSGLNILFSGESQKSITNLGHIESINSDAVLISYKIDNSGEILAKKGAVELTAAEKVILKPSTQDKIFILPNKDALKSENDIGIDSSGKIEAIKANLNADGNPYSLAINVTGIIEALGISKEENEALINIKAKNSIVKILDDSTLLSKNEDGTGGTIKILAENVVVEGTSKILSSNDKGDGKIFIGGSFQGKAENILNAKTTYVGPNVFIDSSAIKEGNGGDVVVWADETTGFFGTILAKGGEISGNGANLEVSGKQNLYFHPEKIDTTAKNGKTGTLLLDPANISIVAGSGTVNGSFDSGIPINTFTPSANNATIGVDTLNSNLDTANIIITTSGAGTQAGDITIDTPTTLTSPGNSLTLRAQNDILINSPFTFTDTSGGNTSNVTLEIIAGSTADDIVIDAAFTVNDIDTLTIDTSLSTADVVNFNAPLIVTNSNAIIIKANNDINFNSGSACTLNNVENISFEAFDDILINSAFNINQTSGSSDTITLTTILGNINQTVNDVPINCKNANSFFFNSYSTMTFSGITTIEDITNVTFNSTTGDIITGNGDNISVANTSLGSSTLIMSANSIDLNGSLAIDNVNTISLTSNTTTISFNDAFDLLSCSNGNSLSLNAATAIDLNGGLTTSDINNITMSAADLNINNEAVIFNNAEVLNITLTDTFFIDNDVNAEFKIDGATTATINANSFNIQQEVIADNAKSITLNSTTSIDLNTADGKFSANGTDTIIFNATSIIFNGNATNTLDIQNAKDVTFNSTGSISFDQPSDIFASDSITLTGSSIVVDDITTLNDASFITMTTSSVLDINSSFTIDGAGTINANIGTNIEISGTLTVDNSTNLNLLPSVDFLIQNANGKFDSNNTQNITLVADNIIIQGTGASFDVNQTSGSSNTLNITALNTFTFEDSMSVSNVATTNITANTFVFSSGTQTFTNGTDLTFSSVSSMNLTDDILIIAPYTNVTFKTIGTNTDLTITNPFLAEATNTTLEGYRDVLIQNTVVNDTGGNIYLISKTRNIIVGTSSETSRVGTINGTVFVNCGGDLTVESGTGVDDIAQIGYNLPGTCNIDLTIEGNLLVTSGTSGSDGRYAVIGNGQSLAAAAGTYSGDIIFTKIGNDVSLIATTTTASSNSFVQIGHIRPTVAGGSTVSGDIRGPSIGSFAIIPGTLKISGGAGGGAGGDYALLGHGGTSTAAEMTLTGKIMVQANNFIISGLFDSSDSFAGIGFITDATGSTITIDSSSQVQVLSNGGISLSSVDLGFAFIGADLRGNNGVLDIGFVNVQAATDINMLPTTSGTSDYGTLIGVYGANGTTGGGNVRVTAGSDINMNPGDGNEAWIRNKAATSASGFELEVIAGNNINLFAGSAAPAEIIATDTLFINNDNTINFSGTGLLATRPNIQSSGTMNIQTGAISNFSGIIQTASPADANITSSGDIELFSGGDITIDGALNLTAGGDLIIRSSSTDASTITTTSSSNILANNISMMGFSGFEAEISNTSNDLTVKANNDVQMNAFSKIVNNGTGNTNVVVDNNFPDAPFYGIGSISIDANATLGRVGGGPLRIFTSQRSFNSISSSATFNGSTFIPGTLFVDSQTEIWSTYFPSSLAGSPFTIFYKTPQSGEIVADFEISFVLYNLRFFPYRMWQYEIILDVKEYKRSKLPNTYGSYDEFSKIYFSSEIRKDLPK